MKLRALAVCLVLLLSTFAAAKAHRRHKPAPAKFFPATKESVLLENQIADALGARRYIDEADMQAAYERGELVEINVYPSLQIQKSLPKNRRCALPATVSFIQYLSSEFYLEFHKPLVVNSATRPATVQKKLGRRNRNAAPAYGDRASSHERGTTLDISRKMKRNEFIWLGHRLVYYRALGRILIIEERGCLHIFVRRDT